MKVILGFAQKDEPLLDKIAEWLADHQLDPVLLGLRETDSLLEALLGMEIQPTDRVVVALSSRSVGARWLRQEVLNGALIEYAQRHEFDDRFVSTVLLRACEVPIWLRDRIYANFVSKDFDTACEGLYTSLVGHETPNERRSTENAIFRTHHVEPLGDASFALVAEFGVAMTRAKGLHVEVDAGTTYTQSKDWFASPNCPAVPLRPGGPFFNSSLRRQPPIYSRKFVEPEVTPTRSYYLYLEAYEPIQIKPRIFVDSQGQVIR